jgi:hypothetical protein
MLVLQLDLSARYNVSCSAAEGTKQVGGAAASGGSAGAGAGAGAGGLGT